MYESSIESPAVSDGIDEKFARGGVIDDLQQISYGRRPTIGLARTATVVESSEPNIPGLAEYLDGANSGDVLVLGWKAGRASIFGGNAAFRSKVIGCHGLITDGWVRDVDDIRESGLSVWALGQTPRSGKGRLAVVGIGQPTDVGGQNVHNQDTIVADQTGICVVGAEFRATVIDHAAELATRDREFQLAITEGLTFEESRKRSRTM